MKKLKIKKGYIAGLLTLFLAAAGLHVASAYATNVIDPAEPCTLTLSVPKGEEYTEELNGMELHAKIYQVATVDAAGEYSETSEFKRCGKWRCYMGRDDSEGSGARFG